MKALATALMVSASMLLAGAVQAEDAQPYPPEVDTSSSLTRAQVLAELHAAQDAGLITQGQLPNYPEKLIAHSAKVHAQQSAQLTASAKTEK